MINVNGAGRLAKDAEVFTYGQNKTGLKFPVICPKQNRENTVYVNCTMFGPDENLAQYLTQGNQVIFSGELDINAGNDGNYYTSVIVNQLEFGAKKQ